MKKETKSLRKNVTLSEEEDDISPIWSTGASNFVILWHFLRAVLFSQCDRLILIQHCLIEITRPSLASHSIHAR